MRGDHEYRLEGSSELQLSWFVSHLYFKTTLFTQTKPYDLAFNPRLNSVTRAVAVVVIGLVSPRFKK